MYILCIQYICIIQFIYIWYCIFTYYTVYKYIYIYMYIMLSQNTFTFLSECRCYPQGFLGSLRWCTGFRTAPTSWSFFQTLPYYNKYLGSESHDVTRKWYHRYFAGNCFWEIQVIEILDMICQISTFIGGWWARDWNFIPGFILDPIVSTLFGRHHKKGRRVDSFTWTNTKIWNKLNKLVFHFILGD